MQYCLFTHSIILDSFKSLCPCRDYQHWSNHLLGRGSLINMIEFFIFFLSITCTAYWINCSVLLVLVCTHCTYYTDRHACVCAHCVYFFYLNILQFVILWYCDIRIIYHLKFWIKYFYLHLWILLLLNLTSEILFC